MITGGIAKRELICEMLPDIAALMNADCMYSVTDTERFIAYIPGRTVDIKAAIGGQVPQKSPLTAAYQTKSVCTMVVPREVWGVPFRSTATPIIDDQHRVVGCVGIGISIDRETQLVSSYQQFAQSLDMLTGQLGDMRGCMGKLNEDQVNIRRVMEEASAATRKTEDMLSQISRISDMTDLLAINASVEAARAGQSGQGFAVVAREIKSLSANTHRLTTDIQSLLKRISDAVTELTQLTHENSVVLATQNHAMDDLKKSLKDMHLIADEYGRLIHE